MQCNDCKKLFLFTRYAYDRTLKNQFCDDCIHTVDSEKLRIVGSIPC